MMVTDLNTNEHIVDANNALGMNKNQRIRQLNVPFGFDCGG